MENNQTPAKDEGRTNGKKRDRTRRVGGICLPECAYSWRRVFNETLGCYEIYVKRSNFLVATGIGAKSDSFLIGAMPAIVTLMQDLINQIENGEVKKPTFKAAKYILNEYRTSFRKGEGMGRHGLFRLDTVDTDLEGQGGGSYTEDQLFPDGGEDEGD